MNYISTIGRVVCIIATIWIQLQFVFVMKNKCCFKSSVMVERDFYQIPIQRMWEYGPL